MRKGHDIIGLRVIGVQDVADLGKVRDLVFDANADACVGLVLEEGGLLRDARAVEWEQIRTIGPDAVMVESSASRVESADAPRVRAAMEQESHLSGSRIMTQDGNDIGTFGDIVIDESTGRVQGYEVSSGFVSDTMSGKRFLPATTGPDVGRDAIMVPTHVEGMLDEQSQNEPGGLKAAYQSATAKAGDAYDTAKTKVGDTYANIASASVDKQKEFVVGKTAGRDVFLPANYGAALSPSASPSSTTTNLIDRDVDVETTGSIRSGTTGGTTAETSGAMSDVPVSGSMTTSTPSVPDVSAPGLDISETQPASILDPQGEHSGEATSSSKLTTAHTGTTPSVSGGSTSTGTRLVATGDTITREHADVAERAGILSQLVVAAGGGALASRAPDTSGLRERASTTGEGVQDKTTQLLESARVTSANLVSAAQQKKQGYADEQERRRIMHALGRPITRVLLAQDDTVILNAGDIITNKAVRLARDNSALDVLLASVYDQEPEITPEMMRVQGAGEAALPSQAAPSAAPITATVTPDQPSQPTPSQGTLH